MSLQERQDGMRRRLESERARQHEEEWAEGSADALVSRHSSGMTVPETHAIPARAKGAADAQTDVPRVRLLDLKAAGRYLGLSYWTMRDLVFGGLIPTVKIPCPRAGDGRAIRRILVDRRDLDAFIEKNKELEE